MRNRPFSVSSPERTTRGCLPTRCSTPNGGMCLTAANRCLALTSNAPLRLWCELRMRTGRSCPASMMLVLVMQAGVPIVTQRCLQLQPSCSQDANCCRAATSCRLDASRRLQCRPRAIVWRDSPAGPRVFQHLFLAALPGGQPG